MKQKTPFKNMPKIQARKVARLKRGKIQLRKKKSS